MLGWFEKEPKQYERLRPLLKDILVLHDTIRHDSRDHWLAAGGHFGKLAFVESKKRGEWNFPFTGNTAKYRLTNGALYPLLASFRWMVDDDRNGSVRWRGGFSGVCALWDSAAEELLRTVNQTSVELGRNPNAIGKSRNLWASLHRVVAMRDLMNRAKAGT